MTSEGETASGTLSDGSWGGTTLRQGSTGSAVEQVQFWLNTLAQYDSAIPSVTVDGVYGTGTANAVRAFQRRYGLTVDGVMGQNTWNELYDEFRSIQSDNGAPNAYPGIPLRQGASGQNVRLIQFWLKIARNGVFLAEQCHGGRTVWGRHYGSGEKVPELLRPHQRWCGGPRHLDQTL